MGSSITTVTTQRAQRSPIQSFIPGIKRRFFSHRNAQTYSGPHGAPKWVCNGGSSMSGCGRVVFYTTEHS